MAIAFGADAIGFNFFPGSKRYISMEENAGWMMELPAMVSRVAVLVNASMAEATRIAQHPAIDCVQFHGDEDASYCAQFARLGHPFIKALRLKDEAVIASAASYSTRNVLVDAFVPGAFGGTGASVDMTLATQLVAEHPGLSVILAGGLNSSNVNGAIRSVRPYALDVATGVESYPGKKNAEYLEAFFRAAHLGIG